MSDVLQNNVNDIFELYLDQSDQLNSLVDPLITQLNETKHHEYFKRFQDEFVILAEKRRIQSIHEEQEY